MDASVAVRGEARRGSIRKRAKSPLVEAMMRAEFYPERPAQVEFKQTHMSDVFLAGEYVYKVKKPVHFDFADTSTLAVRYQLCCEEVRLNRRLTREIYLGVVPIFRDGRRFFLGDESKAFEPRAREYAIKMRRLPENRMLESLVRSGEVNVAAIDLLAKRLADFHREVPTASGSRYGSATAIRELVHGNLDECRRFIGKTLTKSEFTVIDEYLKGFVEAHRETLDDRVRQGHVCEGHGDLRCEHICMTSEIQIFDCLEFSERLRWVDVASDIGFLAMDLDSLGASRLADELVDAYGKETADEKFATLTTFYKSYRACVRGKVASLKSQEDEVPSAEREQARDHAQASFSLALRYALLARPALVLVCGLAGTGKSTVARALQYHTGFEMLNSDRIRKRIARVPETLHSDTPYGAGIYSSAFDRVIYETLLAEAGDHLRDGRGVIVDATFKRPEDRQAAIAIGRQCGVPALFVECQAGEAEVLRRLRERASHGVDPSDATGNVYLQQRTEFVPIKELSPRHHIVVDTTAGTERALACIEESLGRLFEPIG